jgi:hypothetical protein
MVTEAQAKHLLSAFNGSLSALPNVVGVGITDLPGASPDVAIAVYVTEKVPESALKPADLVPKTLTGAIDGVAVEAATKVIAVGKIQF